ncbi:proline--tRNA ligase [Luteipulveratus mongoliensis]|uniref:Proline--tRNA ligase n=1 Tax=Luteipulveratus mongoliensis TaxID=571913 RepID=A0A0K1JIA8_9MICO|nr:proline--tRNA ligase [Luteipulveratus mongoliensis]AKU16454.1 prolyl-tRNA synthetase [Luteipulveratus mongoliensis]
MALRMSTLFLRTLREDPADAELPGHKLLVRAGYIRRVAPGIYTWLPLGMKVLGKVEDIVREEMNQIGSQEVKFPALLPREPYEATGRWTEYGDNLFRLQDRKETDLLLGPTHEEMFCLAVKDMYSSYKDLPLSLYQIQNKYRDEARPRAGILRGREFIMKDAYSFDIDQAGLQKAYDGFREAYVRIFNRLGFEYVIVHADSGAMGGSASEEFLAVNENGEDTFVRDEHGYAANVEAVTVPQAAEIDASSTPTAQVHDTPDTPTIATLVDALNANHARTDGRSWDGADTLKNVLVMLAHPDGTREPLAIGLPGDREVDAKRLEVQVAPAEVEPFEEKDFAAYPMLAKGYIGPGVLGEEKSSKIRYLLDPSIAVGSAWVTGADEHGKHVLHLVHGRDFTADGTIQAGEIRQGDISPDGKGTLKLARGIEMGHIFQLGTKYAEALGLKVLDENGKLVTVTMGSYGVGVTRAVGVIAEDNNDEYGLVWPREIAPADVHVVVASKDAAVYVRTDEIVRQLEAQGLAVLYDDRPKVSPGVKFKDAELIGVPTILVIGKGLADGKVEIKDRRSGERREVAVDAVVTSVVDEVRGS